MYIRTFSNKQSNKALLTFLYVQIVFLCCLPSAGSIKVSPCAKWNTTGNIVAGVGGRGDKPDQLNGPMGIFIHRPTNTLYVADSSNNRVQMFTLNNLQTTGTTVIFNITYPSKIYVDDDKDGQTIYAAIEGDSAVKKWTKGAPEGI
ncbi:unnamed protein product [Adineta steineri]|uniref:Uncharacterized protein n=1 Tax=Adineta steineri TaxID=433720 RepID=A0A814GSR5_9BILA|nr:unnamed protein product [Adineta steineri]CAF4068662.1 unnamed protein product [Adineta steineri]